MTKNTRMALVCFVLVVLCCVVCSESFANNLSITNVSLEARNPSAKTVVVEFDLSWENAWKAKFNHDAVWLTVRLYDTSVSPADKKLCKITASGTNPPGTSYGSNAAFEVYVPSDKYGAFVRPASYGAFSSFSTANAQLTINYDACGFSDAANVQVSVFGLEMVYVHEGEFYAGDYAGGAAALVEGSADTDPWYISGESAIAVTNATSNGYRYVSNGNPGEASTGDVFSIPAAFPKGYAAFYVMKYELTEGQWVDFVNSLPSAAARANRDLTDNLHKNTDNVLIRNTIVCSGSPLTCSTSRPSRAVGFLSWMDLAAFLDWASLRPMTELEFEKAARGPLLPVAGEFAWGSTEITAAAALSGSSEDGTETVSTSGANACCNNVTLTGGDAGGGFEYAQGPLRAGIFATSSSTRISSGGSYYGVMELSGNVRERVVTVGNATGRTFAGSHGDGVLTTVSGYEGNANGSNWPGTDGTASRGVTGATGSGFKGGGWDDQSSGARLRISDRYDAANASTTAFANTGGRGVRTY